MESRERPEAAVGQNASPELLAAQARLLEKRAAVGIPAPRPDRFQKPPRSEESDPPNWPLRNAVIALQQKRLLPQRTRGGAGAGPYPNAAAWLSTPDPAAEPEGNPPVAALPGTAVPPQPAPPTITVHPTMLLAMLRQHQEVLGRVWLLLRAMDSDGRGWVTVNEARARLATKDSPWRFCGWRRLRQLLAQGEGSFWTRDDQGRLWLRGAHRVALALDLGRVQGFPVALPIASLLGGIREVRAAFYAAFHSSRESKPISRDTLQALSGLAPRTQLDYDRVARVDARRNLALGDRHSTQAHQERAWQRGRGVFRFVDIEGRQGRPGGEYVAWHLPNSYEGPHARRSRGHRRRLNRKLADLVNEGIPGNSGPQIERVFWPDGAAAAKGFNRAPQTDAYWQPATTRGTRGGAANGCVWQVLGRVGERGK